MDDLADTNLQIILRVIEGKNFDTVENPTVIVATLNGHSMETVVVQPDYQPQYETDLVWEAEKQCLRKMRAAQTPLKLESFAVKDNGRREKLGYILLSVRSAQIVPRGRAINVKRKWHPILGLKPDLKACKPELLLSLTIEDRDELVSSDSLQVKPIQETNRSNFTQSTITPKLVPEERLIQLGPLIQCHDMFTLQIIAETATNLDLLLNKQVENDCNDDFIITYHILGNDVQLKSFKNVSNKIALNEKVVIRIRSSLDVLKTYLESQPFIMITLRCKNTILGRSRVDIRSLITIKCLEEFLKVTNGNTSLNQSCLLIGGLPSNEIKCQERSPSLDIQVKLQYFGPQTTHVAAEPDVRQYNPVPDYLTKSYAIPLPNEHIYITSDLFDDRSPLVFPKYSEIDHHRNPGGDFGKGAINKLCCSKSCGNIGGQHALCEPLINRNIQSDFSEMLYPNTNKIEAYHGYCLNVNLNAVKFDSSDLANQTIEFRFHHPKAKVTSALRLQTPVTIGEKINLNNIGCKLHFISLADEIKLLLLNFPPKVSICYVGSDVDLIAETTLDVQQLFSENKSECNYEASLINSKQNFIGSLNISMLLEDQGPYSKVNKRNSDENLGPPILDDSVAYKFVDELEAWKEQQMEIFRLELRKKEEQHLNLLSQDWQNRKKSLDSKLSCSVQQCKILASRLNTATEDLRTRRLQSFEKEARLMKMNEELQWKFDRQLQHLRDLLQKTQEELQSKVIKLEEENQILSKQVEPFKAENERLQQILNQQAEKLEIYEKGSLTQDQTTTLLQEVKNLEEKLNNAQKSKMYFKEQWGKAVRDIHKMKMENQQALEQQIKNNKQELQNLDLEEILRTDVVSDKMVLGQFQKEFDITRSKPALYSKDPSEQIFAPVSNLCSRSNRSVAKSDASCKAMDASEKLNMLRDERDSLLKTGSYTKDDAVIVKLNMEIRSLLINS